MISNSKAVENWITGASKASSRNIYHEGNTIFSYGIHFPMARLFPSIKVNGKPLALSTTRCYSNSTSRHLGLVGSALWGAGYRVIEVENPCAFAGYDYFGSPIPAIELFVTEFRARIEVAKQKLESARTRKDYWRSVLSDLRRDEASLIKLGGSRLALARLRK